jgi:hypothetical protein
VENGEVPPRKLNKIDFEKLFITQLLRQLDLVRIGYFDDDFGQENWINIENKWKIFDKNSIYPIHSLDTNRIQNILQVFTRVYGGTSYAKLEKSLVSNLSTKEIAKITNWLQFALEEAIKNSSMQTSFLKNLLHNLQNSILNSVYQSKFIKSLLKLILPNRIIRRFISTNFH